MHEMSLVRSLLRQAEAIANEHDADSISEIRVEVGPLSGVEPDLVQSAFDQLVSEDRLLGSLVRSSKESAQLVIREIPLTARCLRCKQICELTDFVFHCSHCESQRVQVVSGDQFQLVSVTFNERCSHA